jgi:hypothetical protein
MDYSEFDWTALRPHSVDSSNANDGYPLQEPGSLSLVNASTPQHSTFNNTTFGEDVLHYLDPLVSCSSSTQLNSAKFGIEPNTHIQQLLVVEICTDPFRRKLPT